MIDNLRGKKYYKSIVWLGTIICLVLIVMGGAQGVVRPDWFPADDFVEYWAAGQLNSRGDNPYDPQQLLELQQDLGRTGDSALMMWNPPWTLPLVMLLGTMSYPLSRTLWLLLSIGIVFICSSSLWRLYKGQEKFIWIGWLMAFAFIPVLDALKKGQTGFLALLGVVGFLYFIQRKNLWIAGAFLALLLMKPHLTYLFLVASVLWALQRRFWPLILGFITTMIVLFALALLTNPQVLNQYISALMNYPPSDWATPTIGGVLRLFFGYEKFWLQFLAPILGLIWFTIYWLRKREAWDWLEQSPVLVLVSILTAAYGWSFDQPVLLVAIIQVFALLSLSQWRQTSWIILIIYLSLNVLNLFVSSNELWLWWLAPALLAWYFYAILIIKKQSAISSETIPNLK